MRLILLLLLLQIRLAGALDPGDQFYSGKSRSYVLVRKLGEGDFGSVWIAEDLASREKFAIKFFDPVGLTNATLDAYSSISRQQDKGQLGHLIRTYGPETYFPSPPTRSNPTPAAGVRLEIGNQNIESLESSRFSLRNASNHSQLISRIVTTRALLQSVTQGILELKNNGLNHHDLNPRNILAFGDTYKISDLDEVRAHGVAPKDGAFEPHTAPIEYEFKNFSFNDGNLSDTHQFANSLYKLLFGKYRMEEILASTDHKTLPDLREALAMSRDFKKHDEKTVNDLKRKKLELFPRLETLAADERAAINEVFDFLSAALVMDSGRRRVALANLPLMSKFNLLAPISPANEVAGQPAPASTSQARCRSVLVEAP